MGRIGKKETISDAYASYDDSTLVWYGVFQGDRLTLLSHFKSYSYDRFSNCRSGGVTVSDKHWISRSIGWEPPKPN
jgi:hypothetical protein